MRQDRPFVGTGVAIVATVLLIILFVTGISIAGLSATQYCGGSVVVVDGREVSEEQCSGIDIDWTTVAAGGALMLLSGAGILAGIASLRGLGRRWNSPIYRPSAWAAGTGMFLALLGFWTVDNEPYAIHGGTCVGNECTSYTDVEPLALLIVTAVVTAVAIPFIVALRGLYHALHRPRRPA